MNYVIRCDAIWNNNSGKAVNSDSDKTGISHYVNAKGLVVQNGKEINIEDIL